MAANFSWNPILQSNKPLSKQWNGHERRRESRHRRRKSVHHLSRCPQARQVQWPVQYPTSMATPDSSTSSLSLLIEHASGITMERTPSGNSILSDTPSPLEQQLNNTFTYSDEEAASRVINHVNRLPHHSKHQRILRKLIGRDDYSNACTIDDDALASVLTAADKVFFDGALSKRVTWEWSSQHRYRTELIGTTALRRCGRGGFETLIVLSEPILRDQKYDRSLLLSAFLHELVHCYLFILCGFEARNHGGHTNGFHTIAKIIDNWVGGAYLNLCNTKANLDHYQIDGAIQTPIPIAGPEFEIRNPRWRDEYEVSGQILKPVYNFLELTGVNYGC